MLRLTCAQSGDTVLRRRSSIESIAPATNSGIPDMIKAYEPDREKQLKILRNANAVVVADSISETELKTAEGDVMTSVEPTLDVLIVTESFEDLEAEMSLPALLIVTPLCLKVFNPQTGVLITEGAISMGDRTELDPGIVESVTAMSSAAMTKAAVPKGVNTVIRVRCRLNGYRLLYVREDWLDVSRSKAKALRYQSVQSF